MSDESRREEEPPSKAPQKSSGQPAGTAVGSQSPQSPARKLNRQELERLRRKLKNRFH